MGTYFSQARNMKKLLLIVLIALSLQASAQYTSTLPTGYTPFATQMYYKITGGDTTFVEGASGKGYHVIAANQAVKDSLANYYTKTAADVRFTPLSRTLTINGTTQDLSANRIWSTGTVTSVTGTVNQITVTGTTTPVISLPVTITGLTSVTSTGFTGALTGNATTATTLANTRTIWGQNFNGSANIGPAALTGVTGITTSGGYTQSGTGVNGFTGKATISLATQFNNSNVQTGDYLYLYNLGGTPGIGQFGGGLVFSKINSNRRGAAIVPVQTANNTGTNSEIGLAFFTHTLSSNTDALSEAMRITHSGNIQIGSTTATAGSPKLDVTGSIGSTSLTSSRVVVSDANNVLSSSATTSTELGYVSGVTSAIQTQLGTKAPLASPTFTGTVTTPSIIITGGASNGYVLKSDASGNASWQSTTSSYKGIWNASTNTPTIADGTGSLGDYYEVSISGTQFGRSFSAGGRAIYNGTIWEPVGISASVTSVNGYTGTVALVKSDIALGNVDNTSDATKNAATVTLTNKTISGASNTLTDIGNSSLTNSAVTIGSTSTSLGGTSTTLVGLTSVTSTSFVGDLTGNAATSTTTGTVTTAAQPAITSVGTLSGLTVTAPIVGSVTGSSASFTGSLSGDITGTQSAAVVGNINGVSMAGLTTGILKNTTTTGTPSIAVAGDFPILNQNTTGTASNVTGIVAVANGGTGSATGETLQSVVDRGSTSTTAITVKKDGTNTGVPTFNIQTVAGVNQAALGLIGDGTSGNPLNDIALFTYDNAGAGTGAPLRINRLTLAATFSQPIVGSITGNAATATSATSATTAGTVTTAAQPAITSVGTLTGLTVTNPIAGNITGNAASATTAGTITGQANSATITASASDIASTIAQRNVSGDINARYFNTTTTGVDSDPIVYLMSSESSMIRKSTAPPVRTFLGVNNVDNTSDANKPVSTATQTALNLKQNVLSGTGIVKSTAGTISYLTESTSDAANTIVQRDASGDVSARYFNTTTLGVDSDPINFIMTSEANMIRKSSAGAVRTFLGVASGTTGYIPVFTSLTTVGNSNWISSGYTLTPDNNSNQLAFSGNTSLIGSAIVLPGGSGTNADAPTIRMGNTGKTVATMQAQTNGVGMGFLAYSSDFTGTGNIKRYGTIGIDGNWYLGNNDGSTVTYGTEKLTVDGNIAINNANGLKLFTEGNGASWLIRAYNAASNQIRFNYQGTDLAGINSTTGAYTALSDRNKKKNFEAYTGGLNEVLQLKPTLYNTISQDDGTPKELGFVAQDVQPIVPQAYTESGNFIGLNYTAFTPVLVNAIKELLARIQALEAKAEVLETK